MRWGGQPVTHNPYSQDRLLHRIVRREGVPGARKAPLCDPPCEVRGVGLTRGHAGQRDYSLRATVEYCTNCGNLLPGGKDTTGGVSQAGGGSSVGQTDCWSRVLGQCLDAQARASLAAPRRTRRSRSIHARCARGEVRSLFALFLSADTMRLDPAHRATFKPPQRPGWPMGSSRTSRATTGTVASTSRASPFWATRSRAGRRRTPPPTSPSSTSTRSSSRPAASW